MTGADRAGLQPHVAVQTLDALALFTASPSLSCCAPCRKAEPGRGGADKSLSLSPTNSGSVALTSYYNAEQIELRLDLTIKPKHPTRQGWGAWSRAGGNLDPYSPQSEPRPVPTTAGGAREFLKGNPSGRWW